MKRESISGKKPMEEWVKVNTDAVLFSDGSVGVRCVMRDLQGVFLGARCSRRVGAWSPMRLRI